jgi:O-antigen/teichoic acid export membrane protein
MRASLGLGMSRSLASRAGSALVWRTGQLAGVQGLSFLRTLILARLLLPDDFGLVAIGVTAVGSVMVATDLGVLPALVQRDRIDEEHYDTAWTLGVLRGAIISLLLVPAAPLIADLFLEPRSAPIIRVLCLGPLIESLASMKVATLQRRLDFRALALLRVPPVVVDMTVAISLATTLGVWALVAGSLASATARSLISYLVAPYRPRLRVVRHAALSLIRFGRWVFARGILSVISGTLIQVAISRRLGADALGLYFLAGKLAYLPHEVASQVVGEVAFPLYARLQHQLDQVTRAFRSILIALFAGLAPVYAVIFALAPSIVNDLLGPEWAGTEDVIRVLSLVGIVGILGDAAVPLFLGLGRPDIPLATGVLQTSVIAVFLWLLVGEFGVAGAAAAWLPAIGASQLLSAGFAIRLLDRPFLGLGALPAVIATTALGMLTAYAVDSMIGGLAGLFLALTASGGVIGLSLWGLDRMLGLGILATVPRLFPQLAPTLRRWGIRA